MMKQFKLAALAAAAGFAFASAQASTTYTGDLLVGFTTQSGTDFIYDIGSAASLTDGKSWDLSSHLSGYNLNLVYWGVIGDKNVSGTRYAWMTFNTGTPTPVPSLTAWGQIDNALGTIYQFFPAAGAGQFVSTYDATSDAWSWNKETLDGLASATSFQSVKGDPNTQGKTSVTFYSMAANGSSPVNAGSFTLSGTGLLTYNAPSYAPPAPHIVSVTRTNTTSYITFTTTNGSFNYSLYFTNSTGLSTSVTNWPHTGNVMGDGSNKTLTDTTTDANRFYRVGVQ